MFTAESSPPDILRAAILEKPTAQSLGAQWHIGNVEYVNTDALYFALGRIARSRVPVLDNATGNFADTEFDSAPYTHVLIDISREIAAIAHKSSLAPDVTAIARQLARLLAETKAARREKAAFSASAISRPDQFIRELRAAYAVSSFTVYFTRPNPIDVDGDFLQPMERLTQAANGTVGSTTIRGQALDPEPLTQLTRSAAATGDNASARIRTEAKARPVKRSLLGDTAKITQESLDTRDERQTLFERLRSTYARIRDDRETA